MKGRSARLVASTLAVTLLASGCTLGASKKSDVAEISAAGIRASVSDAPAISVQAGATGSMSASPSAAHITPENGSVLGRADQLGASWDIKVATEPTAATITYRIDTLEPSRC